jgi:hypothetical protein
LGEFFRVISGNRIWSSGSWFVEWLQSRDENEEEEEDRELEDSKEAL